MKKAPKSKAIKIKLDFYHLDGRGVEYSHEFAEQELKAMTKDACKPCWELHYCPYGPLVEGFPLPPISRDQAKGWNAMDQQSLKSGKWPSGKKIDSDMKKILEKKVAEFNENDYVQNVPSIVHEMSCSIFGHLCPVFFNAEPYTETEMIRSNTRKIPRHLFSRIVRRDNSICQVCKRNVLDNEIHIDHIIPIARGGATNESNLRVLCPECNRKKSDEMPHEILNSRTKNRLKNK